MEESLKKPPLPAKPPWPDVSPLDGHALDKELDVLQRLKWIDSVVERHQLASHDANNVTFFADAKRRISERQRETRLFLGVVGEFSSGKSTLINALIRQRLLRSDILQGTTAAATIIAYGDSFTVTVHRHKKGVFARAADGLVAGARRIFALFQSPKPPPSRIELLGILQRATSEEEFARDIMQVDVAMPSEALNDGVVIVDTPGANANNPRHGQVTAKALRELCDASLIAVPADAAGAESLLNYLKTHAGDVLHRCVFVVTKMDLLRRQQDRARVVDTLRARLSAELSLPNPRVLAAAPQFVVDSLPFDGLEKRSQDDEVADPEEANRWIEDFVAMEVELRSLLREKRLQAQADDIGTVLSELYRRLKDILATNLSSYRARHEALESIVIPDIRAFIDGKRDAHVGKASVAVQRAKRGLSGELTDMGADIVRKLHALISECSNSSELKTAMESGVQRIVTSGQHSMRRHVERVLDKVSSALTTELMAFHEDFQKHYRSLATLGGKLTTDARGTTLAVRNVSDVSSGISANLAAGVENIRNEHSQRVFGGGAAGAAIGTLLLPGVGTVVGGVVGSLFSSMFGPSLAEMKERCWQPLRSTVCSRLDDAIEEIIEGVEEASRLGLKRLSGSIDDYAPKYEQLVKEMRQRDEAEKKTLAELQSILEKDMDAIDHQQGILSELQNRIRTL